MLVCETHHKAVLRRVVLVAILADKAFTRTVVSFAFSAAAVFHLEPLKVSFVLHKTCTASLRWSLSALAALCSVLIDKDCVSAVEILFHHACYCF